MPDETLADDLLSGNASPATQTPLANSGNITPDDENQVGDGYNVAVGQPVGGEDNSNDGIAVVDGGGSSNEGDSRGAQSIGHTLAAASLPTHPGSRGGHQMVIDSSTQVGFRIAKYYSIPYFWGSPCIMGGGGGLNVLTRTDLI